MLRPALLLALAACTAAPSDPPSDTEVGETETDATPDTDVVDTDSADTDPADTDPADSDPADTDTAPPAGTIGGYAAGWHLAGTRLRPVAVLDAEDNESFVWFEDTALGVRCTPRRASDGILRCLPERQTVNGGVQTSGTYGDSACTQPAFLVPASCPTAGYYGAESSFEALSTFDGYYPSIYADGGRGCGGSAFPAGYVAIALERVADAAFVAFTATSIPRTAELAAYAVEGDDGSRAVLGLWSVDHAQPTSVSDGRAIPYLHTVLIDDLVRADCASAQPDAVVVPDLGYTPAFVRIDTPYVLPPRPIGPPPPPVPPAYHAVLSAQTTACANGVSAAVGEGQVVYRIANASTPTTDFPAIFAQTDQAPGWRFTHYIDSAGTPIVPAGAGMPTVFDAGQAFSVGVWDDTLRATPAAEQTYLYGDSGCTLPVAYPGAVPGTPFVTPSSDACTSLPNTPAAWAGAWVVPTPATAVSRTVYGGTPGACYEVGFEATIALTDALPTIDTLAPAVDTLP